MATKRVANVETTPRGEAAAALMRNAEHFRRYMGLSQEDLAAQAGIPRKTIFNTIKFGNAETRTAEKLAAVFGVTVATLYEPNEEDAVALFLAAQITRLSTRGQEIAIRALAGRAANDRIRNPRTPKVR